MTITDDPASTLRLDPKTSMSTPHVTVLMDRCAGCQECVIRCPVSALAIDPTTWTVVADDAACVGCRQCVRTCPFSAIMVDGPLVVAERGALETSHPASLLFDHSETRTGIGGWHEAIAEANRCLDCPDPTCVRGCPAHNDIPGFIRAIKQGDLDEAHKVLRRTTFLPDVCSRVCDQAIQCEGACTWSLAGGQAVAIGALERFVADNAPVPPLGPLDELGDSHSADFGTDPLDVGVIGSGPAGIGAASELVQAGARVTVYERDDQPGGLLRWGIPDFTLPDALARRPWDTLIDAGVRLELGSEIAPGDLDDLLGRHDAVVVAAGASTPLRLAIPGSDLEPVWDATRFLTEAHDAIERGDSLAALISRHAADKESTAPQGEGAAGPMVLVLGAGNTAMDVARSARRLGARALCVDWMDRRFAPVRPDELEEAAAEGVEVRFCTTLQRLEGERGRVRLARLARTRQDSPGELPKVLAGLTTTEQVDIVVMAMGYRISPDVAAMVPGVPVLKEVEPIPDRRWQASGILANSEPPFARRKPVGMLALGREHALVMSGLARRERVWVAGDSLIGPSTVVEAMAQGKRVARSIVHHSPRRQGHGHQGRLHVLIAVESRSGTTRARASELAAMLRSQALTARVLSMRQVGPEEIAWADLLVVATWVEGFVVANVGPAKAARRWLAELPPLAGMPVSLLCTYAVSPESTLAQMRKAVEEHGGRVVAESAISRRHRPGKLASAMEGLSRAIREQAEQEAHGMGADQGRDREGGSRADARAHN